MNANTPKYLTLAMLAQATIVDRGALERMLARGIISPDAQLKRGRTYVPLFLEENAVSVLLKRQAIETTTGILPPRNTPLPFAVHGTLQRQAS